MSDGSLTQDEIDALLQGSSSFDVGDAGAGGPAAVGGADADLGPLQTLLGGTAPAMASNLSLLVTKTVKMAPPKMNVMNRESLADALEDEVVMVSLDRKSVV